MIPSRRLVCLGLGAALLAALAAGPLQAQYSSFGKNKIQYRDFEWQIYHSPHFNVYFYKEAEPLLQKVVSFAESAYDQLSREFNYQIKDPIPLIFFSTHSAFEQNNVILNFIPEGVGAFATAARFRMVMPVDLADPELMQLMLHELTHIFQYHIVYQGSIAKAVTPGPPTWFMEGMASYMAKDESARDKMFLRDAVVNDRIPSVTQGNFGGFFAYRFGHAVFDFIEERWGKEGFLDFMYETRNTLGARVERSVKRSFRMEPEDFDVEFRRWLRKKYLAELVRTGEPGDFGRIFRIEDEANAWESSPAASPSGDLVAAITNYRGDVDVALFDAQSRTFLRNLTRGFSNEYQYLAAQEQTLGRGMGRDLAFSPDGNRLAVFAKRERGRSLMLLDVLNGGLDRIIDMDEIEQQQGPAWSPDGRKVAFSGFRNGQFDIFELDLESREIVNVTNDPVFDGAPTYSPDGGTIIFVSSVGNGYDKLFRVERARPGERYQVTAGESNENDPVYSSDGTRVYFTSDRDGFENIHSLDFATGEVRQYTNVVTGAFMPTVLREPDGERVVFTGYWKGSFDLYVTDAAEPIDSGIMQPVAQTPTAPAEIPPFEPDIQVSIDEANKEGYSGRKFFLEDSDAYVGVDSNQTVLGRVLLTFSDYLGNRRIIASFGAVESFSNFDVIYADLSRRWQWQAHLFDHRDFYVGVDERGFVEQGDAVVEQTGLVGSIIYPFTFYRRAELGLGYIFRKIDAQSFIVDEDTGQFIPVLVPVDDNFPIVSGSLVGDSSVFAPWGAVSGRRWRVDASYAPDLENSGTLLTSLEIDVRQYLSVTQRSNLAFRVFAGRTEGNEPNPFYFGGLDTVRGFEYRSLVGDRAFFANVEYRFPLIDFLATPILGFQGIRGVAFFDIGGAYFNDFEEFDFYDSEEGRLDDAVSSYGFGVSARLLGLDVNWDFAKLYDFKDAADGFETSFWIGTRF